ncbi:MAG: inner membrane CreD family protein [Thermoanaerobaculia bacterium]
MTIPRLFAIGFIFACTAVGWFVLGGSVVHRSGGMEERITPEVAGLWGGPQAQVAPTLQYEVRKLVTQRVSALRAGETVTRDETTEVRQLTPVPLAASRVEARLSLEHRRRGLLWHDTYVVEFVGRYRAVVPADAAPGGRALARLDFPSSQGIYDGFTLRLNGREAAAVTDLSRGVEAAASAEPGTPVELEVAYRSRGLDTWGYRFVPEGVAELRDFELVLATDFTGHDFPPGTLSPTEATRLGEGWRLRWAFDRLVSGQSIGLDLPNRENPGPLAARITFFAPVSLLFFLTVFVVLGALRRVNLHPMNYFFLAAAFFAFHLLLAYLVDHLNIHLAFALAAAVSLGLVGSYLRLVAGARGAVGLALLSQVVFLVLFSYAFFFRGFTGLTVTVGSILTLFVLMRLTARVDWNGVFGSAAAREDPVRS